MFRKRKQERERTKRANDKKKQQLRHFLKRNRTREKAALARKAKKARERQKQKDALKRLLKRNQTREAKRVCLVTLCC